MLQRLDLRICIWLEFPEGQQSYFILFSFSLASMPRQRTSYRHFLKVTRTVSNLAFLCRLASLAMILSSSVMLSMQRMSSGIWLMKLLISQLSSMFFSSLAIVLFNFATSFSNSAFLAWVALSSDLSLSATCLPISKNLLNFQLSSFGAMCKPDKLSELLCAKTELFFWMLLILVMNSDSSLLIVMAIGIILLLVFLQKSSSILSWLFSFYKSVIAVFFSTNFCQMKEVLKFISFACFSISKISFLVLSQTISRSQSFFTRQKMLLSVASIISFFFISSISLPSMLFSSRQMAYFLFSISFSCRNRSTSSTIMNFCALFKISSFIATLSLSNAAFFMLICQQSRSKELYFCSRFLDFYQERVQVLQSCLYFSWSLRCSAESKNSWSISNFTFDFQKIIMAFLSCQTVMFLRIYVSRTEGWSSPLS